MTKRSGIKKEGYGCSFELCHAFLNYKTINDVFLQNSVRYFKIFQDSARLLYFYGTKADIDDNNNDNDGDNYRIQR